MARNAGPPFAPLTRHSVALATACVIVVGIVLGVPAAHAQESAPSDPLAIAGKIDLMRLVDLASARLGFAVEYDANALKAVSVELRLDQTISDERLWDLTNQLLAARGFTSVHLGASNAGSRPVTGDSVFSIVKLSDAAGLARIEPGLPLTSRAGFVSVWLTIQHRPFKEVSEAVKALISKTGGATQEVASQDAILISDLRPRVDRIVELIQAMDTESREIVATAIDARNVPASELAVAVTAAVAAANAISAQSLQGKLMATADNSAMVLVAPQRELPKWKDIIAQFDRRSPAETRAYAASSFALSEVAKMLEQTARDAGPRGSGDRWKIVQDNLSGMLMVTATSPEHVQVAAVLDRLNALPAEVRRPVRAFPIRNRSVTAVVDVLTKMLEAGVLDAEVTGPIGNGRDEGPASVAPGQLQRTDRSGDSGNLASASATSRPAGAAPTSGGGNTNHSGSTNARDARRGESSLTITADEGTNTLIAVGEPRKLDQLQELLRTLDVRQPQVMVEVLVVSLSEGQSMDLGVELQKIAISGDTVITLASLFGLGPVGGGIGTGKGFSGLILNPGDFTILIRALQTLNNGRSLNIPRVLVNNNQQANLDAVVQQPFVSTNASSTVATTSFGGFENAGTTITVKPQIAKGDHLVLEYAVSLSAFVGESSDPGVPPPRQQNNLQSVVTVPDGYTVVVGGIEIQTKADAVSQVPLLGSVPFIGEAFKSRSRSDSRSRFFVFIRPTILRQEGFEDLKYLSGVASSDAVINDGFPEVEPRIIK